MIHAELHDRIDIFRFSHTLVEAKYSLVDHGHQDSVGNEAGEIIGFSRGFSEFFTELPGDVKGLIGCGQSPDHLDELHYRYRIHEVHADHLLGALGLGRNASNGNG